MDFDLIDTGILTCLGLQSGSLEYETKNANTNASLNVDYLKYDSYCNSDIQHAPNPNPNPNCLGVWVWVWYIRQSLGKSLGLGMSLNLSLSNNLCHEKLGYMIIIKSKPKLIQTLPKPKLKPKLIRPNPNPNSIFKLKPKPKLNTQTHQTQTVWVWCMSMLQWSVGKPAT
ncbi:unnamed protein product [Adineta ricciae]|uniref:Uncharacterized protein n=1 Tax=Adineta ricciae TaxID=249248 RepID=A0A815JRF6_ADIRI|nr:unnamed protein product [Adineta ricciae]CAF1384965.1 unnamed protein product [Adineta ricciae]